MNKSLPALAVLLCATAHAGQKQNTDAESPLFDMQEIRNVRSLDVEVLQEWHSVTGAVPTRQKLISICVGELWPGQDYRIPVRMIVPARRKAKGFHLTGGHQLKQLQNDAAIEGVENELIKGGVGLVQTIVQEPKQFGQAELAYAMRERFIDTLNPHYSIQYWAWPATLMRATTAAYAEKDHFEKGKVALSGASKNGASPSVAIIADERLTALHATVSPIWESPLRLCERRAWDELDAFNRRDAQDAKHPFLGGTFGPVYNAQALDAGHTWNDVQGLALRLVDSIFISRNLATLNARNVDLYFHPGTHDFVAFDIAWGGRHYPQIPVYLRANSGHGKGRGHPTSETNEQNKAAFLLQHFFPGVEPMLESPTIDYQVNGKRLRIAAKFKPGAKAESGRIWWMYNRGPDGSNAYIQELFPGDQWQDMDYDAAKMVWTAEIDLETDTSHIDFFSNHRKTIQYQSKDYPTYVSSPYTRVQIGKESTGRFAVDTTRASELHKVLRRAHQHKVISEDWGTLTWLASKALGNAQGLTVGYATIKAGHTNPRHRHPESEEVLYLLKGRINHTLDDKTITMSAGDVVTIAPGVFHNASCIGSEDAETVIVYSSGTRGFELE